MALSMRRDRSQTMRRALFMTVLGLLPTCPARADDPAPRGLGFAPVPMENLLTKVQTPEITTLMPDHLDWRDSNIITPAKDQRSCGGCWAFAAIGLLEAMAVRAGADPLIDLSEQHLISCDHDPWWINSGWVWNDGCCSGTVAVFEFLTYNDAVYEVDFTYQEGDSAGTRDCGNGAIIEIDVVPCPRGNPPPGSPWRVASWHVVGEEQLASVEEMKAALQNAPLWVGFYVYPDFRTYWNGGVPTTYSRSGNWEPEGGHAVLLIGYDDPGEYWICKNSWGATAGPFGDGTFRMAYDANTQFGLNATSITIVGGDPPTGDAPTSWGAIRQRFQ